MTVLQFPRVYFRGEISWDPGLANNNPEIYDAERVELTPPPDVPLTQLRQHLLENARALGIWNYYGTHEARFESVAITGGEMAPGRPLITDDPLVGKAINLRGKLVDLDAATAHTSQIFFDELTVGDAVVGIGGRRHHRMHSRWLNFDRNLFPLPIAGRAGVVWQTVLAKERLHVAGRADSALVGALATALEGDGAAGLMLRFQTYRTLYFQNGVRNSIEQQPRDIRELQQLYMLGQNFSNPAYSAVVGVIGIWMREDAVSGPSGRYLAPAGAVPVKRSVRQADGSIVLVDDVVELGPAVAELDEGRAVLSLDLGSTIPEQDGDLEKANLGDIEITVQHEGASVHVVTIPVAGYARTRYEERAGIVDADLSCHSDAAIVTKIREGRLSVSCRRGNDVHQALTERPLLVVGDARDVYLDEGEELLLRLRVFRTGKPAVGGVRVLVSAHDRVGGFVTTIDTLDVVTAGFAEMRLRAEQPGLVTYHFMPFEEGEPAPIPPDRLNTTADYFVNVRTLPFDDALERGTPDAGLTWGFVYEKILRVYDTLNSVMARTSNSAIIVPLDDRDRLASLAQTMKRVIAKRTFESARHMPITRDMSNGRRRLLERWCDLVLDGAGPELLSNATNAVAESLRDPRVARP